MDLNEYVQAAILTESRIEEVKLDINSIVPLLESFVAVGNLIDVIKKDTFYGIPTDPVKLQARSDRISKNTISMNVQSRQYFNTPGSQPITIPQLDPRVVHAIIGLATESVELIEALLLSIASGEPIDRVNVLEELGDQGWYTAILVDALNASWSNIHETNIAKLAARNKGKSFNAEATINRDVDAERIILETGSK